MLPTSVVLIAFNRPDVTRRNLALIREARPQRLFLVCDGPRPDRPDDAVRCAEVRDVLAAVDWPCEVDRRFSDVNLGCEGNVELGLDWVFSQVDRAIVLEDDCLADPSFFRYADELLDRYRDDGRVWQIAGNSHGVPAGRFGGDSYAFSSWASVWGWATWADRWQRHRAEFPRDHVRRSASDRGDAPARSRPANPQPGTLVTRSARRHFAEAATSTDVVTHGWDKQWWLTMLTHGGLAVTPAVNLVANDGFGLDATHSVAPGREQEAAEEMPFPLRHPDRVALDVEVERELELLLARIGGRSARIARRVIKSPTMRKVLRGAVHSAPATYVARKASRLTQGRDHRARNGAGAGDG